MVKRCSMDAYLPVISSVSEKSSSDTYIHKH